MRRLLRRIHGWFRWRGTVALALTTILERLSTMNQNIEDLRIAFDAATTELGVGQADVAARLTTLAQQLDAAKAAGEPPTQAQIDALRADVDKVSATAAALKTMGTDPANPVPAPAAPTT